MNTIYYVMARILDLLFMLSYYRIYFCYVSSFNIWYSSIIAMYMFSCYLLKKKQDEKYVLIVQRTEKTQKIFSSGNLIVNNHQCVCVNFFSLHQ
jgi:hypothetical protein